MIDTEKAHCLAVAIIDVQDSEAERWIQSDPEIPCPYNDGHPNNCGGTLTPCAHYDSYSGKQEGWTVACDSCGRTFGAIHTYDRQAMAAAARRHLDDNHPLQRKERAMKVDARGLDAMRQALKIR